MGDAGYIRLLFTVYGNRIKTQPNFFVLESEKKGG